MKRHSYSCSRSGIPALNLTLSPSSISPIITSTPCWRLLQEMDLLRVGDQIQNRHGPEAVFPVGASNKNLIRTFQHRSRVLTPTGRRSEDRAASDTQRSCRAAQFTTGHIGGKPKALGFHSVGSGNKRSIDYSTLSRFSQRLLIVPTL